jgi:hypothetical protein
VSIIARSIFSLHHNYPFAPKHSQAIFDPSDRSIQKEHGLQIRVQTNPKGGYDRAQTIENAWGWGLWRLH